MPHHTPLISTIVVCLVLAFILGAVMHRLRASPLIGYQLAGVIIGPFTPGYIADQDIANQLAELGVILLMFGVGLHFSLEDLLSVRAVAIPGAIAQIAVATALAWALGWSTGAGRSPATRPIPRSSRRSICRRALLARRHSRCVRGWAGGGSGAQDQPALRILARAHSEAEVDHLRKHGATEVVMGKHEIAKAMLAGIGAKTS